MSNNTAYKSTLNLPQTKFPMKADLPKRELSFLKEWLDLDIYQLIRKKSKDKPKYILHDGPPYANGDIHIGHALNKTLKDIVVKYKTMQGFDCAYVPGWDCHGLPIEHQLFKELGISKNEISQRAFRKKAYIYAAKYVSLQKEQFKRLGVFGDWQNPYLTLTPEYENHTSPSIYVKFKLDENKGYLKDTYLLIWTTTPWTLIANVAVAVHPDFMYSYIKTAKGNLILAKDLLLNVLLQSGIDKYEVIKEVTGGDLEGLTYMHPFGFRCGRVVLADYVLRDEGTGLVHIACGHGNEDYITGLKYKLEIVMPVDAKGNFDSTTGEFKGLNVYDANKVIIEKLQKLGMLFFNTNLQHSYPHCWRCKTPIIFRATKQWFLNLQHLDLRKRLLSVIAKDIQWIPESGKERILAMVESRPDWCLSRQRYWGVPIPALICNKCGEESLSHKVIDKCIQFVSKEGSDSWFTRDVKEFLPLDILCPYCKADSFSKGADILDVWFDSGVSHQAILKKRKELEFPCALYLEGSDQHRGWFQSSLIPSMCIDGIPPFKSVLTHGFVVDGEGRKMSKSQGNVISPQDTIKDYGADVLRLWVASSDYNEDIRISLEILSRLAEAYRKVRNTARFILSNLYDFNPDKDKVGYDDLRKIDKWILWRLEWLLDFVDNVYKNFEFYKAYKGIYDFCNEDLSMYYLDMIKGRLYTYAANSTERRQAQTTIFEILNVLVRIIAPLLVFSSEEIWQDMPREKKDSSVPSIHLLDWPRRNPTFCQDDTPIRKNINSQLQTIIELIPDVALALEEKRGKGEIGSSFDAKINVLTNNEIRYKYLESLKVDLCEIFKVSQIEIKKEDNLDFNLTRPTKFADIAITVLKAEGIKCVRCWNYSQSVGHNKTHPLICDNCLKAIGGR